MEIFQIITTIILVVMIVAGVIMAFMALRKRKAGRLAEPNYYTFFVLGVSFIPIGLIWMILSFSLDISFVVGIPFLGLGVTYLGIGLANRDKWKIK